MVGTLVVDKVNTSVEGSLSDLYRSYVLLNEYFTHVGNGGRLKSVDELASQTWTVNSPLVQPSLDRHNDDPILRLFSVLNGSAKYVANDFLDNDQGQYEAQLPIVEERSSLDETLRKVFEQYTRSGDAYITSQMNTISSRNFGNYGNGLGIEGNWDVNAVPSHLVIAYMAEGSNEIDTPGKITPIFGTARKISESGYRNPEPQYTPIKRV